MRLPASCKHEVPVGWLPTPVYTRRLVSKWRDLLRAKLFYEAAAIAVALIAQHALSQMSESRKSAAEASLATGLAHACYAF